MNGPSNEHSSSDLLERYREVIELLKAIEGKEDAESDRVRFELLDELMCLDSSMSSYRKAMVEAARRRESLDGQTTP